MVRIARRDTYGLEDVGGGVKVRRRIFAGRRIPDHLEVDGGAFEEDAPPVVPGVALGEPEPEVDVEAARRPEHVTPPKPKSAARRSRKSTA